MREILSDLGLLVMRVGLAATMFFGHGMRKLEMLSAEPQTFPDPLGVGNGTSLYLAIAAEVVCSGLILAGLLTRMALVPLIVTMLVAIFIVHADDPWAKKELATIYLIAYTGLFFVGPGRLSIDHTLWGRSSSGEPGT